MCKLFKIIRKVLLLLAGVYAALVAFFVVGLVWNQTHDARFVPSPLIDKPAPAFRLRRIPVQSLRARQPGQQVGRRQLQRQFQRARIGIVEHQHRSLGMRIEGLLGLQRNVAQLAAGDPVVARKGGAAQGRSDHGGFPGK